MGFIHSGHIRSFVFDVADLYKVEISIPIAFKVVGAGTNDLEMRTRRACRDRFRELRLLERVLPDIDRIFAEGERAVPADPIHPSEPGRTEGERHP